MKKDLMLKIVLSVLLFIAVVVSIIVSNTDDKKEPINVYLFWGNGCPHCEHAKEYFNKIEKQYGDYFEFVEYEVWYDEDNRKLFEVVQKELNDNKEGVPFIVIGDKYFRGYSSSIDEQIIDTILEKYEDEDYVDVVEKVKSN